MSSHGKRRANGRKRKAGGGASSHRSSPSSITTTSCDDYAATLLARVGDLRRSHPRFCDLRIRPSSGGGSEVAAHSLIMAAASPYVLSKLTRRRGEEEECGGSGGSSHSSAASSQSSSSSCTTAACHADDDRLTTIATPDLGAASLNAAVHFAYTGAIELDLDNKDAALPLIAGLQLLDMEDALEAVQTWVGDHLDPTQRAQRLSGSGRSTHSPHCRAPGHVDDDWCTDDESDGDSSGEVDAAAVPTPAARCGFQSANGGTQSETMERCETIGHMTENGAFDINTTPCGPHGECALDFALGIGDEPIDEDAVKMVLGVPGLNVNVTGPEGQTLLWAQCSFGRSRNVELLLADGRIDPNQCGRGESPLFIAANMGIDICVKLLLADPRVDPNLADGHGYTPLFIAANMGIDICVKLLLADPRVDPNLADGQGYTPLNTAANVGNDGCVQALVDDTRVDVRRASDVGYTPLVSACMKFAATFDQIGAPEPPTRCLVVLLKSRRITPYALCYTIKYLRLSLQPHAPQDDGPVEGHRKMARLLLPVLEAELRGEHRWCAYCLKLTPDRDLDKCARCNEVSYCRPLNRRQLEGGHYSAGMPAEEIERRQKEIADCQRLDWKAEHKHDCARFKATKDAEAKEAEAAKIRWAAETRWNTQEAEAAKEAEAKEAEAKEAEARGCREGAAGGGAGGKPAKIKPNEKCPCGSGKKYKKCHGAN